MKPPESFLPDFCSLQTTFILVLASLALSLLSTLADFSSEYDFWSELGIRAFFIIWCVLLSAMMLCLLRDRLVRFDPLRGSVATFCVVQSVVLIVTAAIRTGLGEIGFNLPLTPDFAVFSLRILTASSLVTAAWLRYQYIQARWQAQSRAEVLARLDALQARMQPHFLFNSLNVVAGLIRENPPAAEALLLDLCEVFRAILRTDAKLVPLSEEIVLARQYLNIEQRRLGERLAVVWDLEAAPQDALIPPLSLQPLVENAIRHGIEVSREGGRVEIGARMDRNHVVIVVSNPIPAPNGRALRPGNRLAVANLRARLEACFNGRGRLYTRRADGRYQARVVIPYWNQAP